MISIWVPSQKIPNLLKIGEYQLDKQNFILIHINQRKNSTGRKRRFEYRCDCLKLYITKLRDEIKKEFPWLCRSCRTKKEWLKNEYRNSLMKGISSKKSRFKRSTNLKIRWKNDRKKLIDAIKNGNTFCDETNLKRSHTMKLVSSQYTHKKKQNIKETRKNTIIQKYGVEHISQDPQICRKMQQNRRLAKTHNHWKTNQKLICIGSYEAAFVMWCNKNQIDFDWQIPHKMPNGRIYIVDAFIKTGEFSGTWIEIKGWFNNKRPLNREKWEWFHETYPNSQLWMKQDLKQIGIL